jgi:hypothetical protein
MNQTLFAVIQTYLMKTTFRRKGGGRGIVTAGHDVFVLELQRDENNNNNIKLSRSTVQTGALLLDTAQQSSSRRSSILVGGCKRMPSEDFTKQLSKSFICLDVRTDTRDRMIPII